MLQWFWNRRKFCVFITHSEAFHEFFLALFSTFHFEVKRTDNGSNLEKMFLLWTFKFGIHSIMKLLKSLHYNGYPGPQIWHLTGGLPSATWMQYMQYMQQPWQGALF